jgi:tetratricopeptide (TPR) repeat protein
VSGLEVIMALTSRGGRFRTAGLALALVLAAARLPAQIPERFTNLQVLPKDIVRTELVRTMRTWAGELGVRCHHCHEGPEDLKGMDFAIDTKATKRAAREMARLVKTFNATVSALPPRDGPRETVACYTCHRREARPPLPLHQELLRVIQEHGAAAGAERYRELRRKYEIAGRYDFTPDGLGAVVFMLAEQGRADDALVMAQLAVDENPKSADAYAMLGEVQARRGDRAAAKESLRQALQRDPQHGMALRRMKDLEQPPSPSPAPK